MNRRGLILDLLLFEGFGLKLEVIVWLYQVFLQEFPVLDLLWTFTSLLPGPTRYFLVLINSPQWITRQMF